MAVDDFDQDLSPIMALATQEDLDPLVGYILKAELTEGLTSNADYKEYFPDHTKYRDLIEKEIRAFGGNSFLNVFRVSGPSYREIVMDVADKFEVRYPKDGAIENIEELILLRIAGQAYDKMSDAEKEEFLRTLGVGSLSKALPKSLPVAAIQAAIQASGASALNLTLMVANAVSRALLGHGLSFAANASLSRVFSIFSGPIGWVITGVWTLLDLAGPAYRVTIPCVIHIAMLRRKLSMRICPKCGARFTGTQKFCSECGAKLPEEFGVAAEQTEVSEQTQQ
ncbi:MAG: DUF3944 domain-containing protein [Succinivibrio sp.]|nr:DUF3944 domain-containing protein [Succinivibrio sp.]